MFTQVNRSSTLTTLLRNSNTRSLRYNGGFAYSHWLETMHKWQEIAIYLMEMKNVEVLTRRRRRKWNVTLVGEATFSFKGLDRGNLQTWLVAGTARGWPTRPRIVLLGRHSWPRILARWAFGAAPIPPCAFLFSRHPLQGLATSSTTYQGRANSHLSHSFIYIFNPVS